MAFLRALRKPEGMLPDRLGMGKPNGFSNLGKGRIPTYLKESGFGTMSSTRGGRLASWIESFAGKRVMMLILFRG